MTNIDKDDRLLDFTEKETDIDYLVEEYFSLSLEQGRESREGLAKQIDSLQTFLMVLDYGANGKYREGYDKALSLLIEVDNFSLFEKACFYFRNTCDSMAEQDGDIVERSLDILMTVIAYAEKIDVNDRLNLLVNVIPKLDSASAKGSMIDALETIVDQSQAISVFVQAEIEKYTSDSDRWIRKYALVAIKNIKLNLLEERIDDFS